MIFAQIYFVAFTAWLMRTSFAETTLPVYIFVLVLQLILPFLIEIIVNFESFKKEEKETEILSEFDEIQEILRKNFNCDDASGVERTFLSFTAKFCLMVCIRVLKLFFAGTTFSSNAMFPELVCSINDYAFTFYVELLSVCIKNYADNIKIENVMSMDVRHHHLKFVKLARKINQRFNFGLFFTISFNFILLILSLYWFFIRIIYGPMRLRVDLLGHDELKHSSTF